jgi:hypothetical protein
MLQLMAAVLGENGNAPIVNGQFTGSHPKAALLTLSVENLCKLSGFIDETGPG